MLAPLYHGKFQEGHSFHTQWWQCRKPESDQLIWPNSGASFSLSRVRQSDGSKLISSGMLSLDRCLGQVISDSSLVTSVSAARIWPADLACFLAVIHAKSKLSQATGLAQLMSTGMQSLVWQGQQPESGQPIWPDKCVRPADLSRLWDVIHTESQPSQASGCSPANFIWHTEFWPMLGQVISDNGPVMAVSAAGIGAAHLA